MMKNGFKLFSFLLIIAFSLSCKKKTVGLNEDFTVSFNKTVSVKLDGKQISVKFTKLVEESRCAPDVQCLWAGQVAVRIQLDGSTESIIGFHSSYPSSFVYQERTFKLIEVNYTETENFGQENKCYLRLRVS